MITVSFINLHVVVLIGLVPSALYSYKPTSKELAKLAERIFNRRYSHPERAQQQLYEYLKESDAKGLKPDTLSLVISALAHTGTAPSLSSNQDIIVKSVDTFYGIPGYDLLLKKLLASGMKNNETEFKGTLYELETALKITTAHHEKILAFQQIVALNGMRREIDIMTNKRWLECKSWEQWEYRRLPGLHKQVLDQKALTQEYNATHDEKITFEVVCKGDIPDTLKQWFQENDIRFQHG